MLRELDWGQHFVGVVMSAAVGEQRMYVYSLKEAVQYLYGGTAGLGFASGSKGSVCWYDTEAFIAWTRDMVGDQALAAALADAYEASASHHEAVRNMGVIVAQRYQPAAGRGGRCGRCRTGGGRNRAGRAHERRLPPSVASRFGKAAHVHRAPRTSRPWRRLRMHDRSAGLAYLDNAATTLKPRCVLQAVEDFYAAG